jgi:hypothetical protein
MNEQMVKAGRLARVAEFLQWPCEVTALLKHTRPGHLLTECPNKTED